MHGKFEADFRILCAREKKGEKWRRGNGRERGQFDAILAGKIR